MLNRNKFTYLDKIASNEELFRLIKEIHSKQKVLENKLATANGEISRLKAQQATTAAPAHPPAGSTSPPATQVSALPSTGYGTTLADNRAVSTTNVRIEAAGGYGGNTGFDEVGGSLAIPLGDTLGL